MKRIIIVLLAVFFVAPLLSQEFVNIPDANFLAALIEEGVDTDEDGKISYEEAEAVIDMNLVVSTGAGAGACEAHYGFGKGDIEDLTGIEAFINLDSLWCGGHNLTELDISNNASLVTFSCRNNDLSSLDISNNTSLEYLDCGHNYLTQLNISNNRNLLNLSCEGNEISNLDLSKNFKLNFLRCFENPLRFLHLCNNTSLKYYWGPELDSMYVPESLEDSLGIEYEGPDQCGYNTSTVIYCDASFNERITNRLTKIYPNPSNSTFTLDLPTSVRGELEIHNLNGQLIHSRPITSTSEQIEMSRYAKGIYFVTIRSDAWVRTEKVVRY